MDNQDSHTDFNTPRQKGRIWGGLFLLLIGAIFFLKETDFFWFPHWLFSWPMILIAVGIYIGLKHHFRGAGWLIPIIIGCIFLLDRSGLGFDLHRFIFPLIIIGLGFVMIMRPRYKDGDRSYYRRDRYHRNRDAMPGYSNYSYTQPQPPAAITQPGEQTQSSPQDYLDITSVLGSTHRVVTSKNFKGGDITCFMGGAEIDLSQADINGTVVLDVTTIMGGAKLIVPTNWEVKPEITNVLGGVEDKRQVQGKIIDFNKVLLLKGTSCMGGIELRSF